MARKSIVVLTVCLLHVVKKKKKIMNLKKLHLEKLLHVLSVRKNSHIILEQIEVNANGALEFVRQSLILMMEHSMPGDFARMN